MLRSVFITTFKVIVYIDNSFDKLLSFYFTRDLKREAYISSIAKDSANMVVKLYHFRKHLTLDALLYLYKNQILP